jgi:hypothetical protein
MRDETRPGVGVIVCGLWSVLSILAIASPIWLLLLWPATIIAFAIVVTRPFHALIALRGRDEAIADPIVVRRMKLALVAIAVASAIGALTAGVPSFGWTSKSGDLLYDYALSTRIAPSLLAAIAIAAVWAVRSISARRIAITCTTALVAWPVLTAIRVVREPLFDIDGQCIQLAPWAIAGYAASLAVLSGGALGLLIWLASSPRIAIPRARVI